VCGCVCGGVRWCSELAGREVCVGEERHSPGVLDVTVGVCGVKEFVCCCVEVLGGVG